MKFIWNKTLNNKKYSTTPIYLNIRNTHVQYNKNTQINLQAFTSIKDEDKSIEKTFILLHCLNHMNMLVDFS